MHQLFGSIDLSANQAEASGGSFSPDQIEDQIFTSAVETHLGISNLPGGKPSHWHNSSKYYGGMPLFH